MVYSFKDGYFIAGESYIPKAHITLVKLEKLLCFSTTVIQVSVRWDPKHESSSLETENLYIVLGPFNTKCNLKL